MRWMAPPDRREITLLLFSLTVFALAYNIDHSIRLLGLDPVATQGIIYRRLGLGGSPIIDTHGRKPPGWRDNLEKDIFGDWPWDEGHVAGDGAERSQSKGTGRYGAIWLGRKETGDVGGKVFGHRTVDEALSWWGDQIPQTKLVGHVPGMFSDTVFTEIASDFVFLGLVSVFLSCLTIYYNQDTPSSTKSFCSMEQSPSSPTTLILFHLYHPYMHPRDLESTNGNSYQPPKQKQNLEIMAASKCSSVVF